MYGKIPAFFRTLLSSFSLLVQTRHSHSIVAGGLPDMS
jgi:hypothetical protein